MTSRRLRHPATARSGSRRSETKREAARAFTTTQHRCSRRCSTISDLMSVGDARRAAEHCLPTPPDDAVQARTAVFHLGVRSRDGGGRLRLDPGWRIAAPLVARGHGRVRPPTIDGVCHAVFAAPAGVDASSAVDNAWLTRRDRQQPPRDLLSASEVSFGFMHPGSPSAAFGPAIGPAIRSRRSRSDVDEDTVPRNCNFTVSIWLVR